MVWYWVPKYLLVGSEKKHLRVFLFEEVEQYSSQGPRRVAGESEEDEVGRVDAAKWTRRLRLMGRSLGCLEETGRVPFR